MLYIISYHIISNCRIIYEEQQWSE